MRFCMKCHHAYATELKACPACGRASEEPGEKFIKFTRMIYLGMTALITLAGIVAYIAGSLATD